MVGSVLTAGTIEADAETMMHPLIIALPIVAVGVVVVTHALLRSMAESGHP